MLKKLIRLFKKKTEVSDKYTPFEVRGARTLSDHRAAAEAAGALYPSEIAATLQAQEELKRGELVTLDWPDEAKAALEALWDRNVTFKQFLDLKNEASSKAMNEALIRAKNEAPIKASYSDNILFSIPSRPSWSLIISNDFTRSITRIDKKTQGRVLEALTKIAESPTTIVGDTVKPLTGELKGLWRYRIGDYRLLYDPCLSDHNITLLNFEPRGDVY
ncbi:MAG: type II toxin-antitoxin system RelE/ParE family toxin [Methylococcales bacterium]|nr:type II toxin-antitoxin system RelE/ParE family toxin [Methylococcales bacterium]